MAAGDITTGRRRDSIEELELPGDYYLSPGPEQGYGERGLWFVLPTAISVDPFAEPYNQHNGRARISYRWEIKDEMDGTVSAWPSIAVGLPPYWHGYLEHGVWREV